MDGASHRAASSLRTRRCSVFPSRHERRSAKRYSAIRGLYRQFELIYIVADERDVIRVRTNYRHGEDIYLYRTTATPAQARERFHEYLRSLNEIRDHPRWYNAITTNCTHWEHDVHAAHTWAVYSSTWQYLGLWRSTTKTFYPCGIGSAE